MQTYILTYIHTYTQTHTHMYTHTHTHNFLGEKSRQYLHFIRKASSTKTVSAQCTCILIILLQYHKA